MKRIYMTLGLVAGLFTAVQAQKAVDLEITMMLPEATVPNPGPNDSLRFAFQLKNVGTEAVETSDTLKVIMDTKILGTAVSDVQTLIRLNMPQIEIAPGDTSAVLGIWITNGTAFFDESQAGPNAVAFPQDATACTWMTVYGYSADGFYFQDPGFDGGIFNSAESVEQWIDAFSGNNLSEHTIVFGTGETDLCDDGGTSIGKVNAQELGMNVYPNPASDNINFVFSLDRAAESATIRIVDIAGRTVYTENLNNVNVGEQHININVSSLNAGMYMVELNTGTQRGVSKLTIK